MKYSPSSTYGRTLIVDKEDIIQLGLYPSDQILLPNTTILTIPELEDKEFLLVNESGGTWTIGSDIANGISLNNSTSTLTVPNNESITLRYDKADKNFIIVGRSNSTGAGGSGSVDTVNGVGPDGGGNVVLTKANIGLSNVDNTSDANKPISTATQTALDGKQASLGFTPENIANKATNLSSPSNTTYPTTQAVSTGLNSKLENITGLISQGSNVTITGSGTSGSPYIINSTGGGGGGATNLGIANRTATTLDITSDTGSDAIVPQASTTEAGLLIATDKVKLNNVPADTNTALAGKQATLVSGTNLKTVDGTSLLGSTNIPLYQETAQVWVSTTGNDTTGLLNKPNYPFLTIGAALDALPSTGGVINIGIGTFASPPQAKIKANVWFKGSQRPYPNIDITTIAIQAFTVTAPTKLVGGTILNGELRLGNDRDNVRITHLGVDVGADWITAGNSATNAITLASQSTLPDGTGARVSPPTNPKYGICIDNVVTLLPASNTAFHGILMENSFEPTVTNIETFFGFAGVIIKTMGGTFNNIKTHGHSTYGLIIKANDYTYSSLGLVTNVECRSINNTTPDGAGVYLDGGDPTTPELFNWTVSNVVCHKTTYGLTMSRGVNNCIVDNFKVYQATGNGFTIEPLTRKSKLTNCYAISCSGRGFHSTLTGSDDIYNMLENCYAISNTSIGFDLAYINFNNIVATGNSVGINAGTGVFGGLTLSSGNTGADTGFVSRLGGYNLLIDTNSNFYGHTATNRNLGTGASTGYNIVSGTTGSNLAALQILQHSVGYTAIAGLAGRAVINSFSSGATGLSLACANASGDIDVRIGGLTTASIVARFLQAGFQVGTTSATLSGYINIGASTTSKASMNLASGVAPTTSLQDGDMWVESARNALAGRAAGTTMYRNGVIYSNTAPVVITNTTTETSIFVASTTTQRTLGANFLVLGKVIRIKGGGVYSTDALGGQVTIRVKIGAVTIGSVATTSLVNSAASRAFSFEVNIPVSAVGASGAVSVDGHLSYSTGTGVRAFDDITNGGATSVINTTTTQLIDITAQWGTANANNIARITNAYIELLY